MTGSNASGATYDAPYRGLRVLDFGQGVASPYCAYLLAAYGAAVIKVEPPEGDWSRRLGTTYGNHSAFSAVYNRGKRSLCLDLKHEKALKVARKLAQEADIFIEGLRPGVMARLGLGYELLSRANPRLIYLSISGFGQQGPYSQRPCSDSIAQACSGLVSINVGADNIPHRVGTTISDICTGLYAFQAISAALFARATVGKGRWIDVNLTQSTAALLGHKLAEHMLESGRPRPAAVPGGTYQTRDGWLMVTLVKEAQFRRLCSVLQRDDLAADPRFSDFASRADHADALIGELRKIFPHDTTDGWLAKLQAADVLADRIFSPGEWLHSEYVREANAAIRSDPARVGAVYAARTPGTTGGAEDALSPAPDIGQHSRAVLLEAGYDTQSIEKMIGAGAVVEPTGD